MRSWLQQHVFKVGWLITKNLRTTTILFYTLFLPGVILYEFVYWFFAGVFNVRAERALAWPDAQQVAELRLNFVKLGRNAGGLRAALINLAPFVVGTAIVWWASLNILQLDEVWAILQTEGIRGMGDAITRLLSAADIYLWVYILFTIGNTMMPRWADLKGARVLLIAVGIAFVLFLLLGVADDIINNGLLIPINNALNYISTVFITLILVNSIMTAILGTIEAIIERITGDSATFERGKLIATTRAERLEQERIAAEKARKAAQAARERKQPASAGPPSIYKLQFPTPPVPAREEGVSVRREDERILGTGSHETPAVASPSALTISSPPPSAERATASTPGTLTPSASMFKPRSADKDPNEPAQDDEEDELPDDEDEERP